MIRTAAAILAAFALAFVTGSLVAEDKKTAPDKIVFESKQGNVTFDHTKHVEAAKKDCKSCHPSVFPESKAPLNYKESMHKKAETDKKSCAACHYPGGTAFESKANCTKCHVKK